MIVDDCCALPDSPEQVPLSWASRSPLRIAARLDVSTSIRVTLVLHRDVSSAPIPPSLPALAPPEPAAWICYTDGSYSPLSRSMPERAGWGFVVVSGGDGDADESATAIGHGYGPVVTDELAPTFIGAPRLTNNTGELSALIELLQWLARQLSDGDPPPSICIRPDSTYALNAALGLSRAGCNFEMAGLARRLWLHVSRLVGGHLRHRHIRGHSNHYTGMSALITSQVSVPQVKSALKEAPGRIYQFCRL